MCNKFIKTGDASGMLEAYLSVVTKGSCPNDDNGLFLVKDFDPRLSYVASPISGKLLNNLVLLSTVIRLFFISFCISLFDLVYFCTQAN